MQRYMTQRGLADFGRETRSAEEACHDRSCCRMGTDAR